MFNARVNNTIKTCSPSIIKSIQKAQAMNDYFLKQYEEIGHRLESIAQRARKISQNNTFAKGVNRATTGRIGYRQLPSVPLHNVCEFSVRSVHDRISGLVKEPTLPSVTTKRQLSHEAMGLGVSTRKAQLNSRCLDTRGKQRVKREHVIVGVSVRERVEQLNRNYSSQTNSKVRSKANNVKEVATVKESTLLASDVAYVPPVSAQQMLVPTSFGDQQQQGKNGTLMKTKELRVFQLHTGYWNFVTTITFVTRYLMDKISSLYHL